MIGQGRGTFVAAGTLATTLVIYEREHDMPRRRTRHQHRIGARRIAIAVFGGLAIITSPGCGSRLYNAAKSGSYKDTERYIEKGDDINEVREKDGRTPLHAAAKRGHKKTVAVLLNEGAFVDSRDNEGNTPLHLAAAAGHEDTVRALLSDGADATIRNNAGRTPLDLGKKNPVVRKDLRNAGG